MKKEKFILDLFKVDNVTDDQKNRIIELAMRDGGDNLLKRIEKLEEKVFEGSSSFHKNDGIKKHRPKEMVKFLYRFSVDDRFKWFTHKADFNVDKIDYINTIDTFDKELKSEKTNNLNLATTNFVKQFITKYYEDRMGLEIYYPEYKSPLSYRSKDVYDLIKKGENPFDIVIDNVSFEDIISKFKSAIRFRVDDINFKFEPLLKSFIRKNLNSVDIKKEYTDSFKAKASSLEVYIDVNNFFRGLGIMFQWINDNKSLSNKVTIDLQENDDTYDLIITHKESYLRQKIDEEKVKGISGDWSTLKKYWFSIVDWSIHADFKVSKELKKAYTLNCLYQESAIINGTISENKIRELSQEVGGVKHIITIYKTKNL